MQSDVDWGYWNQMKTAPIWECVLLSVGRDPQRLDVNALSKVIGDAELQRIYLQRLEVAVNHITHTQNTPGLYSRTVMGDDTENKIGISPFVAWAKHLKWDMPLEFTGFVPPPPPLAAVINETPAKHVPGAPKPTTTVEGSVTPQQARERDNLHRIIGALLAYIKGERGSRPQKIIKEAELIRTLIDKFDGNEGVSERNLQKVFSLAKQLLK